MADKVHPDDEDIIPKKSMMGRMKESEASCLLFSPTSKIRAFCNFVISSKYFENFILFCIILNSITLAIVDYGSVDSKGELDSSGSPRNAFVEAMEPFFTWVFVAEMILKVIGMGFIYTENSYLSDSWNKLDFLVVVTSLIAYFPWFPNLSVFRTFRVLRPLRSLSKFPGLRNLVGALLRSLPGLMDVILILCFVLAVFSILGVQFFSGQLHGRCRMTKYPIQLNSSYPSVTSSGWDDWMLDVVRSPSSHRCLDVPNDDDSKTQSTSPWNEPQDCIWPVYEDDLRICSLGGNGWHECEKEATITIGNETIVQDTYCGSNYDSYGNARFYNRMLPYNIPRMEQPDYVEKLGFGFTQFDHIAAAFLSVFQAVTMEGWVDIMYQCQDAYNSVAGALVFLLLVLFGSFFMLNLVLAVITDCIDKQHEDEEAEEEANAQKAEDEGKKEEQLESTKKVEEEDEETGGGSNGSESEGIGEEEDSDKKFLPKFMPPWRRALLNFVRHAQFSNFIMGLIVLNTIILSLDKYPIQPETEKTYETINLILAFAFLAEMILKLGGMGYKMYSQDTFNLFDAFIVVVSMIEVIVAASTSGGGNSGISALRTFRIFRVFKLASKWESFQTLLATMAKTVAEIGNFAVLLLLFMYIYSLVGMQFFANEMRFDPSTGVAIEIGQDGYEDAFIPRSNFDDFLWAFTSIFQILSGENWNVVMYDGWRGTTWLSVIYFLSLVIFGGFIVMNLFLAILLSNFEGNDDLIKTEDKTISEKEESTNIVISLVTKSVRQMQKSARLSIEREGSKGSGKFKIHPNDSEVGKENDQEFLQGQPNQSEENKNQSTNDVESGVDKKEGDDNDEAFDKKACPDEVDLEEPVEDPNFFQTMLIQLFAFHQKRNHKSLYLFPPTNQLRTATTNLINHELFDKVIVTLIILSSIALAFDNPLNDPDSILSQILGVLDYIFSSIFIFEAIVKILSMGFVVGKGTYLKNAWNILDFIIVMISIIGMADIGPGNALRALRTIRVLRPLRMISRRPELKLVVNALFASIPSIVNVMVVCVLFFLIFAIIAVSRFKGTFYQCQDETWDDLNLAQQNIITYPGQYDSTNTTHTGWIQDTVCASMDSDDFTSKDLCRCMAGNSAWSESIPQNFNNAFEAMATLYEISTTEGWVDVMFAAVDNNGIDMQPIRNNNESVVFFFIGFMIIGSFFVMNLFVGVVIDSFNATRNELGGGKVFMTQEQQEWASTQKAIIHIKPKRFVKLDEGSLRKKAYDLAKDQRFEMAIMGCILLNSMVLGIQYFGQSDGYSLALQIVNYIFAFIFTAEAVIKIYALSFKIYIDDSWNMFDFVIVVGTFIGILISATTSANVGPIASVVRIFRIGRIFRLINSAESLRQLFNTLVTSLPSLTNIGGLLFILFFIYAVCGVQLYAKVEQLDNVTPQANFTTFWIALLTLFRFSTGENWNGFMHSLAQQSSNCENDPSFNKDWCEVNGYETGCEPVNGCGDWTVYPFFYSFTLAVTFVMLNLFIGVILDSFSDSEEMDGGLEEADMEEFIRVWSQYDQEASGFIHANDFPQILQYLEPPLGFGIDYEASDDELASLVAILDVKVRFIEDSDGVTQEKVQFLDVARVLAKKALITRQGSSFKELPDTSSIKKELDSQIGTDTSYTLESYYLDMEQGSKDMSDEGIKLISRKFSVVNPNLDLLRKRASLGEVGNGPQKDDASSSEGEMIGNELGENLMSQSICEEDNENGEEEEETSNEVIPTATDPSLVTEHVEEEETKKPDE